MACHLCLPWEGIGDDFGVYVAASMGGLDKKKLSFVYSLGIKVEVWLDR